mgnify:CR=1 FL=1
MKKLLLLSALLIFACGGDDDNNNDSSSFSLVGTWAGTVTDSEDNSEGQVELMFNSDFTGAINIDFGQNQGVFADTFTWTSDDSQININYSDPDNGSEILYYSFVNQNTVEIYADGDAESTTLTRQ